MLSEFLVVVGVSEDGQSVDVLGSRQSTCGSCSAKLGCGHGAFNNHRPAQTFTLPLGDSIKAVAAGDAIHLVLPANGLLKLAFLAYVQPLLLAMALATLVALISPAQVGAQVVALLAGLGFGAIWSLTRTSVRQEIAGMLEISESSHRK